MIQEVPVNKVPGKVLLAGGYGVLQHGNVGLSLTVSSYFYSFYQVNPADILTFCVQSKQISSSWRYKYTEATLTQQGPANKYLYHSILTVINYFRQSPMKPKSVTIHLLFDRGFLSSPESESKQKFIHYKERTKQGLGSSACVVVSMVRLLCELHGCTDTHVINCLSHIANLSAQNSIGSNFDISSAVFGSQLYTNDMTAHARAYTSTNGTFQELFQVPKTILQLDYSRKYGISLIDLSKGSNTVKMVSSFLSELSKQTPQTQYKFYSRSRQITCRLHQLLNQQILDKKSLKDHNSNHRQFHQQYSKITGVEIEPVSIRQRLNQLQNDPNILYVICPGSGGFDSIAVLLQLQNKDYLKLGDSFTVDSQGMSLCTEQESQQVFEYIRGQ